MLSPKTRTLSIYKEAPAALPQVKSYVPETKTKR